MNEDLEARLRGLQPAAPPPELMRDLIAAAPPAPGKIRWLHFALPLSTAAVIAFCFLIKKERPEIPAPAIAAGPSPADFR